MGESSCGVVGRRQDDGVLRPEADCGLRAGPPRVVAAAGIGGLEQDRAFLHRFQEDVDEGALEVLVADPGADQVVLRRAVVGADPFRPDEQDGLVAFAQVAWVAPDQLAGRSPIAARPPAAAMTRPVKRLLSPTKLATKALAGSS